MPSTNRKQRPPAIPASSSQAPTRERILAYLQENRVASVQVLSRAWGLTRADIRYHFNSLVSEGILEQAPRDLSQHNRRGRPEQQYRLAARSTAGNLAPLCAALLDALLGSMPETERESALRALAGSLAGINEPTPSLIQRLNKASAFLSLHGYIARWEAHASGPRILLRSCPYAAVLPTHPELCEMDRLLLEQLVGIPLEQITRMNLSGSKPAACVFTGKLDS